MYFKHKVGGGTDKCNTCIKNNIKLNNIEVKKKLATYVSVADRTGLKLDKCVYLRAYYNIRWARMHKIYYIIACLITVSKQIIMLFFIGITIYNLKYYISRSYCLCKYNIGKNTVYSRNGERDQCIFLLSFLQLLVDCDALVHYNI